MLYAKELAPNLFNTYDEWLMHYRVTCDALPSKEAMSEASTYFLNKEISESKNKICPLIYDPCIGEDCMCFNWVGLNKAGPLQGYCKHLSVYTGHEKEGD